MKKVSRDHRIRTKALAALLVKYGVIDAAAADDPEGYDNWKTWDGINKTARELTAAANDRTEL